MQKAVSEASSKAVDGLEEMFKKIWQEDDETINNGELYNEVDNGEDDIYNL